MNSSLLRSASCQKLSPSFENSTIQEQRQELQLLIAELKDRDKELGDMVAVHQRHLLAWEDDQRKILTLAESCNLLNNELNKRNEIIKSLTKRLKLLESQQDDTKTTFENTQQKFKELSQKVTDATVHCQALEEKNQSLQCLVLELSAKTGQLQAREQELLTMLKLKDKAILETTDHITEFTSKFKKLESTLRAAKTEEFSLNKEKQDLRLRLKELVLETNKLKDDLCEKMQENNKQQEEIIHLKQENSCLRNELALAVEKAKRKDQLLQFAKSKQARTDTELSSLRQIYINQQRDLQFLHVNLESSQELSQKHEKRVHERRAVWVGEAAVPHNLQNKLIEKNSNAATACSLTSLWSLDLLEAHKHELFSLKRKPIVSHEENVDLNSFHLDSPCLTSTQRAGRPQRCEKFSDEDFPLEINNFSVTKPTNRCCSATMDQGTSSPIRKLQHALAESRQMVADLELSTLLHTSPRCSPNSSNVNMTTELTEAFHRTQLPAAEERGAKLPFFSP
ncbi:PREDICTED: coiled-coil domain-containing protein 62 [Cariama cristata]|uniref:coiled-coil domain-containing protein 62 n=1 Tax=Cariama cristata TaxID=54380 RepID=UPI0005203DD4|nr:PREDICTED: coiled-coil domain-containing protein 62 [Cariama cristata]